MSLGWSPLCLEIYDPKNLLEFDTLHYVVHDVSNNHSFWLPFLFPSVHDLPNTAMNILSIH